jgi:F-type H+-transporting ATPase subunit b
MLIATSNFLIPNATFFVELVAFVVLLGIVGKYILPLIDKVIVERQSNIAESLKVIDESKVLMVEAKSSYDKAITKAHEDGRAALDQASKMADEIVADARKKAQDEYDRIVGKAQADLQASRQQAIRDLQLQAGELAIEIARKIVGSELNSEKHKELIEQTIMATESKA